MRERNICQLFNENTVNIEYCMSSALSISLHIPLGKAKNRILFIHRKWEGRGEKVLGVSLQAFMEHYCSFLFLLSEASCAPE
jgi:hypothetical protein